MCLHPRPVESAAGPLGADRAEGRTPRGGTLSSAILYVAIVAIWAGVLIPRWLRRDSSPSSSSERVEDDLTTAEPDSAADESGSAPRPRREAVLEARTAARPSGRVEGRVEARVEGRVEGRVEARAEARPEMPAARRENPRGEPRGGPPEAEHKRVLAARRRLLGMLLILVIGSGALAFTELAAWWVVVPPSVMLLGYMALLRAAAKADAEQRELARASAAPARSSAASPAAASSVAGTAPPASPARSAPAARPAPPPDAEVIDISASLSPAGEEFYDQYADAKLRAVGDLARAVAS